jgi:hypothetical protein
MQLEHLLVYCTPQLHSNHSRLTHHNSLLWLQHWHLIAKRGETWLEMSENFVYRNLFSHL